MGDAALVVCQFSYPDHPHEILVRDGINEWLVCRRHLKDMAVWRFNEGAHEVCLIRTADRWVSDMPGGPLP